MVCLAFYASNSFWYVFVITVTVVDSGCKALKLLGLVEDEQRNKEPSSVSLETPQVQFSC